MKYLWRIVGALCILGAIALLFISPLIKIDGIKSKEFRVIREDLTGAVDTLEEECLNALEYDDFKDELKDNDLPYTKSDLKTQFSNMKSLIKELLDDTISLQEVTQLSLKAPKLIKNLSNWVESDVFDESMYLVVDYLAYEGNNAIGPNEVLDEEAYADDLKNSIEETVDMLPEVSAIFTILLVLLVLMALLTVGSAVTHVCNKGRWLKYILLVVVAALVIGSAVALPMVSQLIDVEALAGDMLDIDEIGLSVAIAPFVSLVILFVPVVLDIVFERKKNTVEV